MLWIKDGPSSPRSKRYPDHAPREDYWWAALDGHANGGVTKYATVADAVRDARQMVPSTHLDFAITPLRHDMAYHPERPADAILLDEDDRPYRLQKIACNGDEGDVRIPLDI